ncbi:MAG: thioredoxin domain-containing protein [Propionibacterium sp.]|nr:thioredoxin domain-containing protein [Propionibacterium sp.]
MSKSKKDQPRTATASSKTGKPGTPRSVSTSRREQLRAQQEAEAKHKRTIRIITAAAIVIALLIVVIVVVVTVQSRDSSTTGDYPTGTGEQIVPPSVNADNTGLVYGDVEPSVGAPEVVVFMDYQCPGCAQSATLVEPKLEELADNGEIQLTYHLLHGLDGSFPGNHSFRAAIGATCADVQGVFPEYSKIVFAGQPPTEGDGWTDKQLAEDYPTLAGLEGEELSAFQTCYADRATTDFVMNMQNSLPSTIRATPSFTVNGKLWTPSNSDLASTDAMRESINNAAS